MGAFDLKVENNSDALRNISFIKTDIIKIEIFLQGMNATNSYTEEYIDLIRDAKSTLRYLEEYFEEKGGYAK